MAVQAPARRGLLVSRVWLQAVGVVVLFGFLILGLLAYRTYLDEPPIPTKVVSTSGQVLFTGKEISRGQQVFLGNGLMEYGSVFGHGAYLGPDFTADYLHRAALSAQATYAGQGSANARQQVINDFQANRYDKGTGRLVYTDAQARAFTALQGYYGRYFGDPKTDKGLRPHLITSARDIHDLTAFFSWSAWAACVSAQSRARPTLASKLERPACSASKAPALTSASTTRRLMRPRSTRAQKSNRLVNGPPASRAATIASASTLNERSHSATMARYSSWLKG